MMSDAGPPVVAFAFEITDALSGKATMSLTADQTAAIPSGASSSSAASKYVFSVQMTYVDGKVAALFSGPFVINPGAAYA